MGKVQELNVFGLLLVDTWYLQVIFYCVLFLSKVCSHKLQVVNYPLCLLSLLQVISDCLWLLSEICWYILQKVNLSSLFFSFFFFFFSLSLFTVSCWVAINFALLLIVMQKFSRSVSHVRLVECLFMFNLYKEIFFICSSKNLVDL